MSSTNFSKNIKLAVNWIENNSTKDYIHISSKQKIRYHEVTGYYIPTLLECGLREKAENFANYLMSEQHEEGCWNPHGGWVNHYFVFDVSQILDGLSEFSKDDSICSDELKQKSKKSVERGLNWLRKEFIKKLREKENPANKHPDVKNHYNMRMLYAMNKAGIPMEEISSNYGYMLNDKSVYEFDVLSHFYAYAFEGCARLGLDCSPFISTIKFYGVDFPERPNVNTKCFVALSQIALSLFLCGEYELGFKYLEYVSKFQNPSGGFYGSNGSYFPDEEVSWAVKFYLDAFWKCQTTWFKDNLHIFCDNLESGLEDKRFRIVAENVKEGDSVLEVGCGKGRYINNIICNERNACDIADASKYIDGNFKIGSALCLPYKNNSFDVVFCAESLEHTIFVDHAIKECKRVLKDGGKLIIIDKDIKLKGGNILHFGEEWLDFNDIKNKYSAEITEIRDSHLGCPFHTAKIIK